MQDPWQHWETNTEANQLLTLYSKRATDAPLCRIVPEGEQDSSEQLNQSHAIMIALGWVEPAWSEASPRGKPLGYKLVVGGKEWLQKQKRKNDQPDEELD